VRRRRAVSTAGSNLHDDLVEEVAAGTMARRAFMQSKRY
jgi:hypothetical protein